MPRLSLPVLPTSRTSSVCASRLRVRDRRCSRCSAAISSWLETRWNLGPAGSGRRRSLRDCHCAGPVRDRRALDRSRLSCRRARRSRTHRPRRAHRLGARAWAERAGEFASRRSGRGEDRAVGGSHRDRQPPRRPVRGREHRRDDLLGRGLSRRLVGLPQAQRPRRRAVLRTGHTRATLRPCTTARAAHWLASVTTNLPRSSSEPATPDSAEKRDRALRNLQEFLDIVVAIESLLQEAIEPDRLPHLLAEGAAMPDRDLVEYLRAEANRALADE